MTSVFMVAAGEYSAYGVQAICPTREGAERFIELSAAVPQLGPDNCEIEEMHFTDDWEVGYELMVRWAGDEEVNRRWLESPQRRMVPAGMTAGLPLGWQGADGPDDFPMYVIGTDPAAVLALAKAHYARFAVNDCPNHGDRVIIEPNGGSNGKWRCGTCGRPTDKVPLPLEAP